MNSKKIRTVIKQDLQMLVEIEEDSFDTDQISRKQMLYHISNPRALFFVFEHSDGLPVAYILTLIRQKKVARLYSLAVNKQYQNQGIASQLIKQTLKILKKQQIQRISLEVNLKKIATIGLYEGFGFSTKCYLPNYYQNGTDAIRMVLELS